MAAKPDIPGALGAAIAGSGAPGIGELTKLARRWGGLEESSLLVLGGKLPSPQPALINSAMGHALDFDDTLRFQAAHAGVLAAALAKEGFTGAKHIFTGQYGFFPMYAPEGYDPAGIEEDLGPIFRRGVELNFKPHPCGWPTHTLIYAAAVLHQELELAQLPPTWARILVNEAVFQARLSPRGSNCRLASQVEAQFSLPYLISTSLCLGNVSIGDVTVMDKSLDISSVRFHKG